MLRPDAISPAAPGRALPRVAAALVVCIAAAASPALAGPDDAADPILKLLVEHGLSEPDAPAVEPQREFSGTAPPDARPHRRDGGRGAGLRRRSLPPRRHLGRDRLRLQRVHAPRLRVEPRDGVAAPCRRTGDRPRARRRQARGPAARRPGLLQHGEANVFARWHLHRRQPLHPFAAPRRQRPHRGHDLRLLGEALHRRAALRRRRRSRRRPPTAPFPASRPRAAARRRAARPRARRRRACEAQSAHGRQDHRRRRPPLPCRRPDGSAAPRGADRRPPRRLGRPLRDLRISVTDRCNFRCSYCMPKEVFDRNYAFLPHSSLLTFEEIVRVARLFVAHGVRRSASPAASRCCARDLERWSPCSPSWRAPTARRSTSR